MDADPVDLFRPDRADADVSFLKNFAARDFARARSQFFGIVDLNLEGTAFQDDRACNHRPRQRAAADFIKTGHRTALRVVRETNRPLESKEFSNFLKQTSPLRGGRVCNRGRRNGSR